MKQAQPGPAAKPFPHVAHPPIGAALRPRNVPLPDSIKDLSSAIADSFQLDSETNHAIQHPYHQHPLSRFHLVGRGVAACNLCGKLCQESAVVDAEAMRCIPVGTDEEKRGIFSVAWCCTHSDCVNQEDAIMHIAMCGRCIWNDPGGLCFHDHAEGTHLCYRSTWTDEYALVDEPPVCTFCRTKAAPSSDFDHSQFYVCFQTTQKTCGRFAVCRRCLNRDGFNLRARNGEDGLMPPPIKPFNKQPPFRQSQSTRAHQKRHARVFGCLAH